MPIKVASKILLGAALAADALTAIAAQAEEGPLLMPLRGVYLDFTQKTDAIPALGVPSDAITITKRWIPHIDFEYFFTPSWSSELVLTFPQSQTATVEQSALGGPTDIGTFKHLLPTLTVKYNVMPGQDFRPYVGIGVNRTFISDMRLGPMPALNAITGNIHLDSSSVGFADQLGFDYRFADHWLGNVDVKYVTLKSDVTTDNQGKVSTLRLDPWLPGIGVSYRN
jgi:outer membrane protein